MGRVARVDIGNHVYHVLNRAVGRLRIFESNDDYLIFEEILREAQKGNGDRHSCFSKSVI